MYILYSSLSSIANSIELNQTFLSEEFNSVVSSDDEMVQDRVELNDTFIESNDTDTMQNSIHQTEE